MRRSVLLAALLLAIPLAGAELVAPPPVVLGPLPSIDTDPVSATNGSTTLVAWVNLGDSPPYAWTWSMVVRTLDAPESAWSLRGFGPILATNGDEYLIAFSMTESDYGLWPEDNVGVKLVSSGGAPGAGRTLNRSVTGSAGGAAWNGEHWMVGYTSDGSAKVALLRSSLDRVATAELGAGHLVDVAMIGRRTWAFVARKEVTEAIEILPSGEIGTRHALAGRVASDVVPTTAGALAFIRLQNGAMTVPFDPVAGFGAARQIVTESTLRSLTAWEGGAAVLVTGAGGSSILGLASGGEIVQTQPLQTSLWIGLGPWRDGVLLFESREGSGSGTDIWAYRLQSLRIADAAELISAANVAWQTAPVIVSTGEEAIAFWTERTFNAAGSVRSRAIDAAGHPFGPIASLEAIPAIDDLAFDGSRFFAVWVAGEEIYAAAISRDGAVAGEPMRIGSGSRPAIASSGGATFLVWRAPSGVLYGTNLRADGSAAVPGGSPLLPAFGETEKTPKITAIGEGFFVGWAAAADVRAVVLTPGGTVLRGVEFGVPGFSLVDLASRGASALGLVRGPQGEPFLYALNGEGRPFEAFDPHWTPWIPHSVTPIAEDRYLVAFARVEYGELLTSEITMTGAFITGIGAIQRFGGSESITVVGATPIGLFVGGGVWVRTGPESARHRVVARR